MSSVQTSPAVRVADAKVHQLVDAVVAELKAKRFGRATIELHCQDGVIVRAEVTETRTSHKFV